MREKVLLGLIILGILDAVSVLIPVTAILLIYVLYVKPPWFKDLVVKLYEG
ncbi:hypothetical protein ACFLU6_10210 [Acidobacteriota bacterium]